MNSSLLKHILFLIVCIVSLSCGDNTVESTPADNTQTITIMDFSFIPTDITAAAGDIIFFYNADSSPHQILSESAENLFDDTGDLDSLIISAGQSAAVTIPSTSTSGTIIYFYDDILRDLMITPNGTITIE